MTRTGDMRMKWMDRKNDNRTPHRRGLWDRFCPGGLLLILIVGITAASATLAQEVAVLEQQYEEVRRDIATEQTRVDSLQNALEQLTARLEETKRKDRADRGEIRAMMANGLSITEQINRGEKRIAALKAQAAELRLQLAQQYSARIDSLRQLENSRHFIGDRAALRRELIANTEKYMQFSPAFRTLSFDPHTISRLDPAAAGDSLERAIITEYLQNAARDVDAHLENIRKNRRELQAVVRLQRKTREFLEEVESDRPGLLAGSEVVAAENPSGTTGLMEDGFSTRTASQALQSYQTLSLFIEQLDLQNFSGSQDSWKFAVDSARVFVSLEKYLEILKAAEQRLQEYQALISQKLESGDPQP